jgi:signal transduction histidine kinase
MADEQQIAPGGLASRQTMREALVGYLENRRQETLAQEREERRQKRTKLAEARNQERTTRAREAKVKRLKAANEVQTRTTAHVSAAVRSLRAALRSATEVSLPRHTPEGRQQAEVLRGIEEAIGSLRRASRGDRHDLQNINVDLDIDET